MVFSRFFKSKESGTADAPPTDSEESETPEESADESESDVAPEQFDDTTLVERAVLRMPTGASTGSKRTAALYGEGEVNAPFGPTHFVRAEGCRVEAIDGTTLVDCTMALGAVTMGYAHEQISRAVMEAAGTGHVTGLSHMLEVEVAERFCDTVPCAEKVQFLKTGAEAVAAAVRIARAYTGRDVVIGSGYFGWHDWCSSAPGVPKAVQQLFVSVPHDDLAALTKAATEAGSRLAAIVIEPVVERLPSAEWIAGARELCDKSGAVLIFDEIKTGFRVAPGGYQQFANVTPDLAAFGKAMANGFPLSAVCGREALMDAARTTWISSTLASEATALAAAYVVIEMYRATDVCAELARIGGAMRKAVTRTLEVSGCQGVTVDGIDPMWLLRFESPTAEAMFVRTAVQHGALFKRGAYNFASIAHDDEALFAIEAAANSGFIEARSVPGE